MMHTPRSFLLVALAAVAACSSGPSSSPETRGAEGRAQASLPGGLLQRVTLQPAVLVDGRDVEIRSVLINQGSAPVAVTTRMCGLDYAGALELTHPPEVLKCAGFSATSTLAPGDSLVDGDLMRVASAPGEYELRVRHVLDPEKWLSLRVIVRAP